MSSWRTNLTSSRSPVMWRSVDCLYFRWKYRQSTDLHISGDLVLGIKVHYGMHMRTCSWLLVALRLCRNFFSPIDWPTLLNQRGYYIRNSSLSLRLHIVWRKISVPMHAFPLRAAVCQGLLALTRGSSLLFAWLNCNESFTWDWPESLSYFHVKTPSNLAVIKIYLADVY